LNLVTAAAAVKTRSGCFGNGADFLGLEGFDRAGAFFGSLAGVGDGVVAEAERVFPSGVLEDRVEDLAMDVDRAGADVLVIKSRQKAADVFGRDRPQFASFELAHDPGASLVLAVAPRFRQQVPMAIQGGRLCSLLELEVLHPEPNRVLEASISLPRRDLLFGFDGSDHLVHLPVGAALVEEAVADATVPLPPASVRVRH
jgi:hypothetical protein